MGGNSEAIEGPSQVSSYTRVPATSFRSVLTHINTRSVCIHTKTTPAFARGFRFFSFFPLPPPTPFADHPFLFFSLFLSLFFLSVVPLLFRPSSAVSWSLLLPVASSTCSSSSCLSLRSVVRVVRSGARFSMFRRGFVVHRVHGRSSSRWMCSSVAWRRSELAGS